MRHLALTLALLFSCAPKYAYKGGLSAQLTVPKDTRHLYLSSEVSEESTTTLMTEMDTAVAAGAARLVIEFNTPGGSVFAGMQLAKHIEQSPVPTVCVVDGMAASMGFYLLQSCTYRVMTSRSLLMAHQPASGGLLYGPAEKYERLAEVLRKLGHAMATHCARRMSVSVDEYEKRIEKGGEWWFDERDALLYGAVDRVVGFVSDVY
jgi:ATP-dependent Clp protease protease subunit